jgi:hypothetical protein
MKKSSYTKDVMGYGDPAPKKKSGGKVLMKTNSQGMNMKGNKPATGSRMTKGSGPFGKAKGIGAPRKRSY